MCVTLVTIVTRDFRDAMTFPVIPGSDFVLLAFFFEPVRFSGC